LSCKLAELLLGLGVLWVAAGADCRQRLSRYSAPPPVLSAAPTLEEIVQVVHHNTARVQTLSTGSATLSGSGFPSLRANLALEQTRRVRLQASHSISGLEFDLGSNDEEIWMWLRRSEPPAMYLCRHEHLPASPMRHVLPIDAEQLVEAFGLLRFDTGATHEGPYRVGAGRLQIRSQMDRPEGRLTRVTVIDERMGWVLEQHLYDAAGRHLATVRANRHQVDPASGATLPRHVEFQWPAANLSLALRLDALVVNQPIRADLWNRPSYPNYPIVDLADPNRTARQGMPTASAAAGAGSEPARWSATPPGARPEQAAPGTPSRPIVLPEQAGPATPIPLERFEALLPHASDPRASPYGQATPPRSGLR
jgi:hypothetical protein